MQGEDVKRSREVQDDPKTVQRKNVAQSFIVASRTMFPLGTLMFTIYDDCMDDHMRTYPSWHDPDQDVFNPPAPLVSEMLPAFLDHLRIEDHRTPSTLIRYESHIQKFITTVGDCPNRLCSYLDSIEDVLPPCPDPPN